MRRVGIGMVNYNSLVDAFCERESDFWLIHFFSQKQAIDMKQRTAKRQRNKFEPIMKMIVAMSSQITLFLLTSVATAAALQNPKTYVADPNLTGAKTEEVSHVSCQL